MKLPPRLELPIDIGGLIVALVVDIVMNVVCFATLAPDMITRVSFVSIGVMIVLFVPRSWSKRQFIAWAIFTAVVFFFDYSFSLVATKAQAEHVTVNVFDDAEVKRLESEKAAHDARISGLQAQYAAAAKRETMDQLNTMIADERALAVKADADRTARIRELQRSTATHSGITSAQIFNAVPDAARDGRWIQLVIFGLIFIGLQLIIATSIDNGKVIISRRTLDAMDKAMDNLPPVEPITPAPTDDAPIVTPDDVDRFCRWTWFRIDGSERNTEGDKITRDALPRDVLLEYLRRRGEPMSEQVYDLINEAAHALNIIDDRDIIGVDDKAVAAARIKEYLCM